MVGDDRKVFKAFEQDAVVTITAQDIGAPGFDTRSGHGLVDAHAAVLAALGQVPRPGLIPEEVVEVRLVQVATGKTVFSATTTEAQLLRFSFPRVGF